MTYFLVFNLIPYGLMKIVDLYKLINDDCIGRVSKEPKIINNNPYGNVYFASVDLEYLRKRKEFVRTTFKPIWTSYKNMPFWPITRDINIYSFKALYSKKFNDIIIKDGNFKKIKEIVKNCVDYTFKEYESKFGVIESKHYIITFVTLPFTDVSNLLVYIVEPINKKEAIKIIQENESLVLWELI